MSPEEKELLRRSIALAEENNDILRSIQRSMRLARLMTVLYWLIIFGVAAGAYYYLQPYIDEVLKMYNSATTQLNQLNGNLKQAGQIYNQTGSQVQSGVGNVLNQLKGIIK